MSLRKEKYFQAFATIALSVRAGMDDVFFSTDESVSGKLSEKAVTDDDNCLATGSEPGFFTSQAP